MTLTPFGRTAAAMITPFHADGSLDLDGASRLADHLVSAGCDALVLSGTTGEAPTTTDAEKAELVRAVVAAVGSRAVVTAGVGTNDTRHSVELARQAAAAGAHGLIVVTPYYSRPTQDAITDHLRTVADATDLPVLLYDIPGRTGTGTALSYDTLLRLAEHPRILGVKDCAYDPLKSARVLAATNLAYYSGSEENNLPLRAIGAVGFISTVANVAPREVIGILDAFDAGDTTEAAHRHQALAPLVDAVMSAGVGTVMAKALLRTQGLPAGPVRGPLKDADAAQTAALLEQLRRSAPGAELVRAAA
ncbi:4-hydroxy-tetrahydrodipicolinate synthase [Streptomyces boninensis]|uniref:4-hydroxy-tetrahydrodipicolinate synthase n=1 Tax=Streptomyces boninensis TaxID=2039455 RepID=UPI003B218E45